jgi:hypothetical protein
MDLRWMLRLYPRAWRARYEDEVAALLEQRGTSLATLVDLLFGALDAHLDPTHLIAVSTPGAAWVPRVRLSNRIVFWAFPLFVLLYGVTIFDEVDGAWDTLRETDPVVAAASWAMMTGILAAFLATVLTGVVLATVRLWAPGSLGGRLLRVLPLTLPPALFATGVALHATGRFHGQPVDSLLFLSALTGLLTLPLVIGRAAARDPLGNRVVCLTQVAAVVVTAGMVAHLSGMLASQAVAIVVWPGGNWSVRLIVGLLVVLVPMTLAVRATLRGIGALRQRSPA